jgi:hypothetical protein
MGKILPRADTEVGSCFCALDRNILISEQTAGLAYCRATMRFVALSHQWEACRVSVGGLLVKQMPGEKDRTTFGMYSNVHAAEDKHISFPHVP